MTDRSRFSVSATMSIGLCANQSERHFFKAIGAEHFHIHKVGGAGILKIVAKRVLDVADVTRRKVCGDGLWSSVENGRTSGTLENV
jgi:hypothetical protein